MSTLEPRPADWDRGPNSLDSIIVCIEPPNCDAVLSMYGSLPDGDWDERLTGVDLAAHALKSTLGSARSAGVWDGIDQRTVRRAAEACMDYAIHLEESVTWGEGGERLLPIALWMSTIALPRGAFPRGALASSLEVGERLLRHSGWRPRSAKDLEDFRTEISKVQFLGRPLGKIVLEVRDLTAAHWQRGEPSP